MSATPEPTVPVEPGSVTGAGVEATQEVQAADTLPQEGVIDEEAQEEDQDENEDEAPQPRLPFPPRPNPATGSAAPFQPTVHPEEDGDSDEDGLADLVREEEERGSASGSASSSGSDNEGEAYVPATEISAAKIPKFKKSKKGKKSRTDGDEDDVGTNGEKKGRSKKSKKSEAVIADDEADEEDAGPALDEGTLRRMALEERIDNIGKSDRKVKRKRKDEEDVADIYHEEVCNRLRERMERAAEKDRVSHENRLPATAKLAMLEDVMAVLRNVRMFQAIVDSRLLEAVSSWLEPMRPSGSLPAEGIQRAIFEVLPRMELDAQTLKETYLGRVVLFYTKATRVQAPIKRQADTLVQQWSRPILRRPADLHNRKVMSIKDLDLAQQPEYVEMGNGGAGPEGEEGGEASQSQSQSHSQSRSQSQSQGLGQKPRARRVDWNERAQNNTSSKGTRLEKAQDYQYQIAPESQAKGKDRERDEHMRRIQMDNMRFNKFARQMRGGKAQR